MSGWDFKFDCTIYVPSILLQKAKCAVIMFSFVGLAIPNLGFHGDSVLIALI